MMRKLPAYGKPNLDSDSGCHHPLSGLGRPMTLRACDLSAVAFDLDDTLFDRTAAVVLLLHDWLGELAPDASAEILTRDACGHSPREPFFHWLGETYPRLGCSGAELWARFRAELPQWLVADPAAAPLLTQLADAGLRTGVLTDGHSAGQRAKLQALGLAPRFAPERVLVTSELAAEKPDARAFGALVGALGVPAGRILFVGDHPEKDIAGAKRSGLKACWLRRQPGGGGASADLVIDSLGDLFPLLWPPQ
jgi:putative hydrolase of the HAD superfamily